MRLLSIFRCGWVRLHRVYGARLRATLAGLVVAGAWGQFLFPSPAAVAATVNGGALFSTLFSFPDAGTYPAAPLVRGPDGALYGTTSGKDAPEHFGTIFRIAPDGAFSTIYRFRGQADGYSPSGPLLITADGTIYGTTVGGGVAKPFGGGTVFRLAPDGTLTVLASFASALPNEPGFADGSAPRGPLVRTADGTIYGTTSMGGGGGTIFRINAAGVFQTVRTFREPVVAGVYADNSLVRGPDGNIYGTSANGDGNGLAGYIFRLNDDGSLTKLLTFPFSGLNGSVPHGPMVLGNDGYFYGTMEFGGAGRSGTVFRFSTTTGEFTVLHAFDFTSPGFGSSPIVGLTQARDGNLYGATRGGGLDPSNGVLFRITPQGAYTVLQANFDATAAALVEGADGNLYGTTAGGRLLPGDTPAAHEVQSHLGGSVYRLAPTGQVTDVHVFARPMSFAGAPAAPRSRAGLVAGPDGNFYGTTSGLGDAADGTVFRLSADGAKFTTLVNFRGPNGSVPEAGLLLASDGNFYGTTTIGGRYDLGTVFRVTQEGILTTLFHFDGSQGATPKSELIEGSDGYLYGTTSLGGSNGAGTIYRLDPRTGSLAAFAGFPAEPSGGASAKAALAQGPDGNFYGTLPRGGDFNQGCAYRCTPQGNLSIIASFQFNVTGGLPQSALVLAADGNFYGTTPIAGPNGYGGLGTLFRLTPQGTVTPLAPYGGGFVGAPLIRAKDGKLYGVMPRVDSQGHTALFALDPQTGQRTIVSILPEDHLAAAPLAQAADGTFYGTRIFGGEGGYGTIFRATLTPAFFNGEVSLGNDVGYLAFANGNVFGYYSYAFFPYLYHFDLGFEYFVDANDGAHGAFLYDFASASWFYTSPNFGFPYLFDFNLGSVLYYFPDSASSGRYTANPRYFFNFATGQIISK